MSEKELSSHKHDEHRVLELAMEMGKILLESGAEIFRVEDTMRRVCAHFEIENCNFFVMGNGILSGANNREHSTTEIRYIPERGTQFDRIVAINQLSREIIENRCESLDEIERRVQEIKKMPLVPKWLCYFASALAAGSFCLLFGGDFSDTVTAFVAGFALYLFLLNPGKHMSKIFANICGGALVTILCLLSYRLGPGHNLGHMISGSILPLVPGVAFTNGIRDIGGGDYLSGTVRLLDAFWTFLCIAIGVGIVFGFYQRITGGTIL